MVMADTVSEGLAEKAILLQEVIDELCCYGPLSTIMRDNQVRELRVLEHNLVMVDTGMGRWLRASSVFQSREHLAEIIKRFFLLCPHEKNMKEGYMNEGFWIALNPSLIRGSEKRRLIGNSGHALTEYNPPIIAIQRQVDTSTA